MNQPIDFIGIGAAKSGTTWLVDCLGEHPDVFIPKKKELEYFNDTLPYHSNIPNVNYENSIDWYHQFFSEASDNQKIGEFSTTYLPAKTAPKKIHDYNSKIKLILLIRNPIEQLISVYHFQKQKGFIQAKNIEEMIELHPEFLENAKYHFHLQRYLEYFSFSQIGIWLYDDLKNSPETLFKEVLDFLNLPQIIPPSLNRKSNISKKSRYPLINSSINKARIYFHKNKSYKTLALLRKTGIVSFAEKIRDQWNIVPLEEKSTISSDTVDFLKSYFLEDIFQLEKLLGKDLSNWYK